MVCTVLVAAPIISWIEYDKAWKTAFRHRLAVDRFYCAELRRQLKETRRLAERYRDAATALCGNTDECERCPFNVGKCDEPCELWKTVTHDERWPWIEGDA